MADYLERILHMIYRRGSINTVKSYRKMLHEALALDNNPKNKVLLAFKNLSTFVDVPYKDTDECKNEKDDKIKQIKLKDERYDGTIISMNPFDLDVMKAICDYYHNDESLGATLINNKIVIKDKFLRQNINKGVNNG